MAEDWSVVEDSKGRKFYHNRTTDQTTAEKPDVLKGPAELYMEANVRNQKIIDDFDFDEGGVDPLSATQTSHAGANDAAEASLGESNVGFQLLKKFGWQGGEGLGKSGQGIVEPVRAQATDSTVGIGKQDEYDSIIAETTKDRKRLDIEIEQSSEVKRQRVENADRESALKSELKTINKEFYCEICDKQYKNVKEMENHLSSYDHHHKKRFKEMKQSTAAPPEDREALRRREEQQLEREIKKRQKIMTAAMEEKVEAVDVIGKQMPTSDITSVSGALLPDGQSRGAISFSMKGGFSMLSNKNKKK